MMMNDFELAYDKFFELHLQAREGERLRRLSQGHGYAEKLFLQQVWWPVVRSFDCLHPEFEVIDIRGGTRFIDFAYIHPTFRIAIEIDGYGPHSRDVNRYQFADERRRQTMLVGLGWQICRFAVDDVKENPEACRQLLQLVLGRYIGANVMNRTLAVKGNSMRYAANSGGTSGATNEVKNDINRDATGVGINNDRKSGGSDDRGNDWGSEWDNDRNYNTSKERSKGKSSKNSRSNEPLYHIKVRDRDIIQFAIHKARPITPSEVASHFDISRRTAIRALQKLVHSGYLMPSDPAYQRVRAYRLPENIPFDILL